MQPSRPFSCSTIRNFIIAGLFIATTTSCNRVFVKNYPKNKPFVFQTNINLTGNLSKDTIEILQQRLKNQLDDSLKVRTVRKLIANWMFNRPVLDKPPVYDSASADRSIIYMKALLVSLGYFRDTITYSAKTDTAKADQYRTTVTFDVKPGRPVPMDSIGYNIKHPELQQLALASKNNSLLKKGEPFAKGNISLELDRLTDIYRNNGYLRFGRDMLQGLWDTIDVELLKPTLDPLEQLAVLQKLKEQRENPKADLEIRLKPGIDTTRLTKYYVGNVTVYPDFNYSPDPDVAPDTTTLTAKETIIGEVKVRSFHDLFKPKLFPPNIYLFHDSLYKQQNYNKTIDRLNALGAWGLVSVDTPYKRKDTADFIIRLTPAKKYSFTTNLEASLNNSAISGNLVGFSLNANLQIRNVFKMANLSSTSIRFGVETGKNEVTDIKFIQTRQVSFSQSFYFPRPLLIKKLLPLKLRENASTLFALNAAYTERRELFNLVTVNSSWGYEFRWNRDTHSSSVSLRIPNFEYSSLDPKPLLLDLFAKNPSLQYVFTDGFISSIIAGYTRSGTRKKGATIFRSNFEASGLTAGLIQKNKFLDTNLYRFVKADVEFVRKINYVNTALVLRFFAGVGYEFNSTVHPNKKNNLPFFKQYFAGGPNSMRAWALRKLGPGSSVKDFGLNPERYGDVQLESNIEYRFPLGKPFGVKVNGALFTDIGNVWFMKKISGRPDEEVFNFSRLGKDIAIGAGFGLRVDLSFFLIRFDYSYKVKDPSPSDINKQNKWFNNWELFNGQFQLGISYPFIL
ncbi:MAG: BamA/TamA family outer membrane protein [Chitinophagaceae bacterium]|nr:BamA/TamA family outer membrane protein [Chitinophagaceae bacterium]